MSKSKYHLEKAAEADNDLAALGHLNDALRESRKEGFEENWLPKLQERCSVMYDGDMQRYTMVSPHPGFGIIDFYPKANKVLHRKNNEWIKPGLKWIINHFKLTKDA